VGAGRVVELVGGGGFRVLVRHDGVLVGFLGVLVGLDGVLVGCFVVAGLVVVGSFVVGFGGFFVMGCGGAVCFVCHEDLL
jgi:hypothetical protein